MEIQASTPKLGAAVEANIVQIANRSRFSWVRALTYPVRVGWVNDLQPRLIRINRATLE